MRLRKAMRHARLIPIVLKALAFASGVPLGPIASLIPSALAQNVNKKRIILKDGTYQIVTKWEIKRDHVRYYSAERAEWEEVPTDLIDWPATDKWNKEHEPGAPAPVVSPPAATPEEQQKEAAQIDAEAAAERGRTPFVAPGLQLPERDGVFVLDTFQGIPELVHLDQSAGNVNRDADHNVLRAAIGSFSGAKEPVRINGQAAHVRVHVDDPALYV
jgi:hypothetical protein